MKTKVRKIIAFIIVLIILLSTSSQAVAHTLYVLKSYRSNKVTYKYDGTVIEDYEINGEQDYSYYCLSGGTPLRDNMSDLYSPGTYNSKFTWDERANLQYKNMSDNISNYEGLFTHGKEPFEWLVMNMYSEYSDNATKKYMLDNLNKIIEDSGYTGCDVNLIDTEFIEVIQQIVIWKFVKNDDSNHRDITINGEGDIEKITFGGKSYAVGSKENKTALALHNALYDSALNHRNRGISTNSKEYKLKIECSDKTAKDEDGDGVYIIGPITLNTDPTGINKDIIENIEDGVSVSTVGDISYVDEHEQPITTIKTKKDLIGKTYYVKFKPKKELQNSKAVTYFCTADLGYFVSSITADIYTNTEIKKQPVLKLKKALKPNQTSALFTTSVDNPFDFALTKQIMKVERYNTSTGEYEIVQDYGYTTETEINSRLKNIDTDAISNNGTAGYNMDKRPVIVQYGDKITYRIKIYNEGSQPGKVTEVTDYLPNGLEYVDYDAARAVKNYMTVTPPKDNNEVKIQFNNGSYSDGFPVNPSNDLSQYLYLDVICRVTSEVNIGDELINYAAITGYKDDSGKEANKEGIDRDSEQNDEKTIDYNTGITLYKKVIEMPSIDKQIASGKIDKNMTDIQDDDDYEIVKVGEFDLALRKYITKINGNDLENSRAPKFNSRSAAAVNRTGTAWYYHPKDTITVEKGDTILYTIEIYNEGYIDGYAKEITDYLPKGLEYVDNDFNRNNGWNATKNADGTTTVTTNKTKDILLSAGKNGEIISEELANLDRPKDGGFIQLNDSPIMTEVQIECRVTDDAEGKLINIAEISNYGYNKIDIKDDGSINEEFVEANNEGNDRDSIQNNIVSDINEYYNQVIDPQLDMGKTYYTGLEDDDDFETIVVKPEEIIPEGSFYLNLVKYIKGTTTPLPGAGFTISIKDETGKELMSNPSKVYTTGNDGKLTEKIENIKIEAENKEYTITVTETQVPEGYVGLEGAITFKATSTKSGDNYVLEAKELVDIANTKKITVNPGEILVEVENGIYETNIPNPPENPHKGIKEIDNQNSGYDANEEHDWVIQSKVPNNIKDYKKYVITDQIDENLVFSGIDKVDGEVLQDTNNDGTYDAIYHLMKDDTYKVSYDENTRMLKISFIEDEFKAGQSLKEGSIIEIRFNTTFALDENGKIKALNELVPNQAELVYDNGQGEQTLKTEIPKVHTGGIKILKYETKDGNKVPLQGATFKIAKTEADAKSGKFIQVDGKDLTSTSNENGILEFVGLEFGGDAKDNEENKQKDPTTGADVYRYDDEFAKLSKDYWVVEVEAPEGYVELENPVKVTITKDSYNQEVANMPSVENVPQGEFDLALRKFITGVTSNVGTEGESKQEVTSRVPVFKIDENGKYVYEHTKEPVLVGNQNVVEYTIRVYNEGTVAGYAREIKDDIPQGLEFLPDDETNKEYRWIMLDKEGNETDDVNKAKYITSDYLSKEQEKTDGENLLKPFDTEKYEEGSIKEPDYRDVKVAFKATLPNESDEIVINKAQISDDSDENGDDVTDKDSTPNEWIDGEDDQDIEKIKVQYFDLALRKWVTKAIVIEDGKETVTETGHKAEDDPEEVVKVDLNKSKLNKVVVKFDYQIRVTNEGEIPGYVKEISDYIPEGLRFDSADNEDWEEVEGKVVTDKLKDTLLNPGESAEVTIRLTWINREDNMGLKVNVAEISKDYNEYGSSDIDSTPNNKVSGEDDIDDAPVMLTIKTGQTVMYVGLGMLVLAILAGGIVAIKKFAIK